MAESNTNNPPREIKILYWFGIIFGGMYIIYALVSIILSFMDRTYNDVNRNIVILIYGLPFIIASIGLKNLQKWGWFGYVILMALVLVMAALGGLDGYGIVLVILALAALVGSFLPSVRKHYFTY